MIPYGRQHIEEDDIQAVVDVLRSDFLTQGPKVPEFERAVADKVGAQCAVAVNSATSALHLACLALDVGPGDIVWTSPITFVASANCARYCGASVDFVDIDPRTYNMSVAALEAKLADAERSGTLPKVVIPVHMCGQSCEMKAISRLSKQYGFSVIEDASHAIGGRYRNEPVGSCSYSDITVFSFHPVKIVTTAEGGMALTNRKDLAERMTQLRSHGITREFSQSAKRRADSLEREAQKSSSHIASNSKLHALCTIPFYYEQVDLGFNYRMTDLQAALGLKQLERLDEYLDRRHFLASRYDQALADLPVVTPWQHPETHSALHLYPIRLHLDRIEPSRRQVYERLRGQGIGVNVHYIPVHLQPYYREQGFALGDFPEAERYYAEALTLPLYPGLSEASLGQICQILAHVLKGTP